MPTPLPLSGQAGSLSRTECRSSTGGTALDTPDTDEPVAARKSSKRKNPRRTALAVRRIGLLPAVALTLVGLAVAGVLVWGLFTRLLRGHWPWDVGALDESTPVPGKETTQIV